MSERAQRQLSAILAADVAGYSRLIGQDEEGTLARLKELRRTVVDPKIGEHRGRIVKTMGDGLLVQFASAVDAVRCAVEVQRDIKQRHAQTDEEWRMEFRIGINVGDVVIDGDDIHGDGVNVAARLEALSEPGSICVSAGVYDHVRDKLDLFFEDTGEHQLKNIARPMRVYRLTGTPRPAISTSKGAVDKPSIAILPFTNMSGDPEQEYFSDGITEDIITELSRFRSLLVIARHSSFQYREKTVDVRRIGRELGVAYVVEGSVRKAGERVRITGQLIETATGNHVWADRFDRDLVDIFAVQDEVVQTIVSRLAVRLETEELKLARRRPPQDMRAYDLWLRGKRCLDLWTAEGNAEARRLFEQAIHIDPACARAHAGLALTCEWGAWYSKWAPDSENSREMALRSARKAVALDDTDHEPHIVLAWIYHERRQFDQSRQHLDRALALNPNDADAMANRAMILTLQGEPEAGRSCSEAAIRLNPHHSDWYIGFLAACHFLSRNYSEVIRLREPLTNAFPEGQAVLAATYALAGDLQQANKTMQEFLSRYHLYWRGPPSARHFTDLMALKRREDHEFIMEGLRMAGMPE